MVPGFFKTRHMRSSVCPFTLTVTGPLTAQSGEDQIHNSRIQAENGRKASKSKEITEKHITAQDSKELYMTAQDGTVKKSTYQDRKKDRTMTFYCGEAVCTESCHTGHIDVLPILNVG